MNARMNETITSVRRTARSFGVAAAVLAAVGLSVAPRSALAKNPQSPATRVSASRNADLTDASSDVSSTFEIKPRVDFRFFSWKEFDANNVEHLSEDGLLFAIGVDPRVAFGPAKRFFVESPTRLYFGKVGYDGYVGAVPYKSKTGYFGFELLPSAGYVFSLGRRFQLSPTAGVGFEQWNRDLDDGGQLGYDEKYTVLLVHAGLRGTYLLNRDISFHSKLGLKVPVSISESVGLGMRGRGQPVNVNLSPGISPAVLVEGGTTIHGFDLSLYYEGWTLAKSAVDRGYLQPESTRKIFGIRLGHAFSFN